MISLDPIQVLGQIGKNQVRQDLLYSHFILIQMPGDVQCNGQTSIGNALFHKKICVETNSCRTGHIMQEQYRSCSGLKYFFKIPKQLNVQSQ